MKAMVPRPMKIAPYLCVAGVCLLLTSRALFGLAVKVDVTQLGAKADGTNAKVTTAAFRQAFQLAASGTILVPAGTYLLDNSEGPVIVRDFSGELRFSANARLHFTANNRGGLWFLGGTKARIYGLRAGYSSPPLSRAWAAGSNQIRWHHGNAGYGCKYREQPCSWSAVLQLHSSQSRECADSTYPRRRIALCELPGRERFSTSGPQTQAMTDLRS